MNEAVSPGPMQLAHEPPFRLGVLDVDPSRRQVTAGATVEILEPRVMQVLVLLAHARGLVVSRDDLIQSSWGGRIVGDDAINRVLVKVRQVAAGIGAGSFSVETVVKVGYRLVETSGATASSDEAPAPSSAEALPTPTVDRPLVTRRTALALGGVGVLAAAGGLLWWQAAPTIAPEAERNYQRGLALRGQSNAEQAEQSVAFMREAIRIQPDYAAAWGGLAWGYRGLLEYGPRPDAARIETLARAAALRALQLDPDNVDAQAAILLLGSFYRRWGEVESGCRRLLRAEDNSLVGFNLAWVLMEMGRFGEAQPIFEELIRDEPFWPLLFGRQAQVLHTLGRVEEAEQLVDEALRRWPRHPELWFMRLRLHTLAGQVDRTLAFAAERSRPPLVDDVALRIETMLAAALNKSAEDKQAAVEQMAAIAQAPAQFIAVALSVPLIGGADLSLEILHGFYFGRGRWARIRSDRLRTGFLFISSVAALRNHAGFMPLVREIGLVQHWRSSGKLPDFLRRR